MKENFPDQGKLLDKVRSFAPATFREKNASVVVPMNKNHKRIRNKKMNSGSSQLKKKDRKALSQIN
jgi:hypothetical protein